MMSLAKQGTGLARKAGCGDAVVESEPMPRGAVMPATKMPKVSGGMAHS